MDKTLSLIPAEGGSGDFPVLKAFQEYIDAEQAKARKRMLGLSVFFVVLLIVVVITFVMILTMVVNRNQALSDRLLDYALKEREVPVVQQVPVAVPQQNAQDSLRPLIEKFERERAEMKAAWEAERKQAEAKAAEAEAKRMAEIEAAKVELERERLRAKKENDRQELIRQHRRRLYPEYYGETPSRMPATPSPQYEPPAMLEVPPQPSQKATPATPVQKARPAAVPPPVKKPAPALSDIKPLTYFNVDDEDDVPFIIDTSQSNK